MFFVPVVLTLAVLTLGCDTGTEPDQVGLDKEFTLAPGLSARIQGEGLEVTFDSVTSDSRCPADAYCVWEGDAVVAVTLTQPARERATVELHTSARFAQTARYGGFEVALVRLDPLPRAGRETMQSAFRATFRVTR